MGLNGIRNRAKLRKVSTLIGEPCVVAFARYFENQNAWVAFGQSGSVWVVNLKERRAEPYTEERLALAASGRGIAVLK